MCSVGEDDFGDEGGVHSMTMDVKSIDIEDEMCKKCSIEKSVIKLDYREAMCTACFLYYVRHKFRASLGCSKIVKRHSMVLLNFQGSPADVCLLHMIKFAFEEEAYKRLCFDIKLIHLDESCMEKSNVKWKLDKLHKLVDILNQFPNFKCSYSSIADNSKVIEDLKDATEEYLEGIVQQEMEFLSSFEAIKSLSSKQDFLETKRRDSLRSIAKHLSCSYIFLSDIGIDLAKKLISDIALGRGSSVAHDVAFCDDKIDSIKIVRPIRDLTQIEVENYCKFNDLKIFSSAAYGLSFGPFASIQNLTSQFIDGLQENYSSTVSTVFKCCNKIAPQTNPKLVMKKRCKMCQSYLDYYNSETVYAIEYSRQVSGIANDVVKLDNLQNIRDSSISARNGDEQSSFLCHGCRNIYSEIADGNDKIFSHFDSN